MVTPEAAIAFGWTGRVTAVARPSFERGVRMGYLIALLSLVIIVVGVRKILRWDRSAVPRRQFPGPELGARNDADDSAFLSMASGSESSHDQGHHGVHHGSDCAPSHDAGGSCSIDGGGGGHH